MAHLVTYDAFVRQFPALVLSQRILPKKREAIVTLLVSAMVGLEPGAVYTETEINVHLQSWVDAFGAPIGMDRVTTRRMLVDEGYLQRDAYGSSYVLRARSPHFDYEPSIQSLDLVELVEAFEREREVRKAAHADRTGTT